MRKKATNKQKVYIQQYKKDNCKRISFELNSNYDQDIIEFLNSKDNKQGYLKELIRKDINSQTK